MKKITFPAMLVFMALSIWGCSREEITPISSEETSELQKAFMREYRECSLRSDAMRDSIFGFEGLKPQWQLSRSETTESGIRFIEVPLNADLAALPTSSSLLEHLDACEGKTVNLTSLIRKEHSTDSTRSLNYFMSMMPSFRMLSSGSSLEHRPGAVPDGFDGEVLFFNLTGELRHKYVYENGSLIRRYRATYRPQMRSLMNTNCIFITYEQDRYYYVVDSDGTTSEPKYNYTRRHTETHCFTSMDFASEMMYDEYGGGSGGYDYTGGGGGGGGGNHSGNNSPEPKVIEDSLFITSRYKCIYQNLQATSDFVRKIHREFDQNGAICHLVLKVDVLENFIDSENSPSAKTIPPLPNSGIPNQIQIIFNSRHETLYPNIEHAATFIHELAHAYMYLHLMSLSKKNSTINSELVSKNLNEHNYPGLFDYYTRFTKNNQHELMAAHYIALFVEILRGFSSEYTQEEYEALAWGGLEYTRAWEIKFPSKEDKDKIRDIARKIRARGGENCN